MLEFSTMFTYYDNNDIEYADRQWFFFLDLTPKTVFFFTLHAKQCNATESNRYKYAAAASAWPKCRLSNHCRHFKRRRTKKPRALDFDSGSSQRQYDDDNDKEEEKKI